MKQGYSWEVLAWQPLLQQNHFSNLFFSWWWWCWSVCLSVWLWHKAEWVDDSGRSFRCLSISSTYPVESVRWSHFQISTVSVSLDPHRAFLDHGMLYILWMFDLKLLKMVQLTGIFWGDFLRNLANNSITNCLSQTFSTQSFALSSVHFHACGHKFCPFLLHLRNFTDLRSLLRCFANFDKN